MIGRALVVCMLLGAAGVFAAAAGSREVRVERTLFDRLPTGLGAWRGLDAEPFADDLVRSSASTTT